MLIVLMYHRIGNGKHASSLETFRKHLEYLKERYSFVLPGDSLKNGRRPSLCLTFDDATFDFYHYIFPLLKKMEIRALLGVPVRYILEKTEIEAKERLSVPYALAMQDGFFESKAPFCTWEEIREMVASGYVEVASHSYAHKNVTFSFVDLEEEVVTSKHILQEKAGQIVSSFIYPFGRWDERVHTFIEQHYLYSFRIGSAYNWQWKKRKRPLCRIPADQLTCAKGPLTWKNAPRFLLKSLLGL